MDVTYVFENGKTYAIHQGKVIAASTDADDVERQVKLAFGGDPGYGEQRAVDESQGPPMHGGGPADMPPPPDDLGQIDRCYACGTGEIDPATGACQDCGAPADYPGRGQGRHPFPHDEPHDMPSPGYEMGGEAGSYMAKTVSTPNGLKGTVLGKVAGVWGDEVTVRLENGRIVRLPVGTELRAHKVAAAPRKNPIEALETRLAGTPDGSHASLVARSNELESIKRYASTLVRDGVSYADSVRLDQIVVVAETEQAELIDAAAHLDDVEAIAPPSFTMAAADRTSSVSREDASWLDHTMDEIIKEAEATDFTKLMDEGPEALTAELPDVALADTGVTRQMASHFVAEKTAGVDRKIADPYTVTFLARVEECRRQALATRQHTTHKEAAAEQDKYKDLPDDALFL